VTVCSLPRPVGFVLGGGGSLGAVQVGMLQALTELGVFPDLVVGTSVGSLNGAVVALDPRSAASLLSLLDAERTYRTTQLAYRQALAAFLSSVEQINFVVGKQVMR